MSSLQIVQPSTAPWATPRLDPVAFAGALLVAGVLTATAVPPIITTQPQDQVATNGASVTLTVAASGSPVLTFHWMKEGLDLAGQTKTNLVLTNVSSNHSGSYSVTVRNSEGAATSSNATLRVVPALVPVQIGAWSSFTRGISRAVAVSGQFAYVAEGDGGLASFDISNPGRPVRLDDFVTGGFASGVQVVGNLAYVAAFDAGFQIIDVTNPASLVRRGRFDTRGFASDVNVVGNRAYVAAFDAGLQIIDVTNPANPTQLSQFDTGDFVFGV